MIKRLKRLLLALVVLFCGALVLSYKMADQDDRGLARPQKTVGTKFAQKDIVVNGLRLRYVDEGTGPVLVFIPGLTSRVEEYDRQVAAFRGKYRVLTLDFPGSGYSDKPVRRYSVGFYVDTLMAFLDGLDVKECYLAGGSLGGNIALRAAARDPLRVRAVAAWGPGSAWEPKPVSGWILSVIGGKTIFWPGVFIQSRYWHREGFAAGEAQTREQFRYYDEIMSPGFVAMYWDLAAEQVSDSLFPIAPEIRQPVLLLWGDHDFALGMKPGIHRLADLLPNVDFRTVKDAGHSIISERPAEIEAALKEFFAAQDKKNAAP